MDTAAPPVMVKASVLSTKLRSAIGDGVESALLLTTSGALLSTASSRVDFARSQECKMLAALVANMWRTYAQSANGAPAEPADANQMMMMQQQQQQMMMNNQQGGGNYYNNNGAYGGNNSNYGGNQYGNNNNNNFQNQQQQRQVSQQHRQQQSAINTDLELVLAELESSKLCCFGLGGRAVLALFASNATELGLLKLKAASLQAELYDGLRLATMFMNGASNSPSN